MPTCAVQVSKTKVSNKLLYTQEIMKTDSLTYFLYVDCHNQRRIHKCMYEQRVKQCVLDQVSYHGYVL